MHFFENFHFFNLFANLPQRPKLGLSFLTVNQPESHDVEELDRMN